MRIRIEHAAGANLRRSVLFFFVVYLSTEVESLNIGFVWT
jgi:hypothetical protein